VITDQVDPHGKPYFWIGGSGPTWARENGTDYNAVEEGYVSLTPLMVDLTHYGLHQEMKVLEREGLPAPKSEGTA
jgi:5'-nucleotidase